MGLGGHCPQRGPGAEPLAFLHPVYAQLARLRADTHAGAQAGIRMREFRAEFRQRLAGGGFVAQADQGVGHAQQ